MNPVVIRDLKIGEGMPKICVPIVGVTKEEIINEAKNIKTIPADLVEWRADWFDGVWNFSEVKDVLKCLREELGNMPLLFTFRTAKEGGEKAIDDVAYAELNKKVAEMEIADLIDVEIFSTEEVVKEIIACAHKCNVKIIASNHDFQKTPSEDEIIVRLKKMQDLDADILKIAVMPNTSRDVVTLLSATEKMVSDYADRPVVTMSMSGKGVISRIAGEVFGSAITFGAAKKASAPGQIAVEELKNVLNIVHG